MTGRSAVEVLETVTSTVSYLRASTGPPTPGWLDCDRLVADPAHLLGVARSTAEGRGTAEDDVAVSLFVQAYAFRIASLGIGGWLLADQVLDLRPSATAILLGRHRPDAVGFHALGLAEGHDPLADLVRVVVDDHLAPLVGTAHASTPIGERLLWGDVAAACASSFGAFHTALPARQGDIRARAEQFLVAAPPPVRAAGRFTTFGSGWHWERSSCCLWYRTASGSRCEDCSLWTDDERRARYIATEAARA